MSRIHRLFELLQMLRRHRRPVSGAELAHEAGISLRTLYRDIAALQAMGAEIEGEPGVGYVLRPSFLLPPLMFSEDEIEALALGARWVGRRTDEGLADAARSALARIAAVLPPEQRRRLEDDTLLVGSGPPRSQGIGLKLLREATREERKLALAYRDERGARTERVVWPFALGFFESTRVLAGWCELRQDFRHFRTDRIESAELLPERYPRRRLALAKEWREIMLTGSDSMRVYDRSTSRNLRGKAMTEDLVFYTHPRSRGAIVHWMLEEVGVPYRIEVKDFGTSMKAPEYLALNRMGKVPAIRHGDVVVTEAAAICAYLADAFPEAALAPAPTDRGAYYRWLFFAAACVEPAMSNHAVGWDPAPELQSRFGYGSYAAVMETLAEAVAGRHHVAGETFTAADVHVGSMIGWGLMTGGIDRRPEFAAYWDGLKDRPARQRAFAQIEKLAAREAWAGA